AAHRDQREVHRGAAARRPGGSRTGAERSADRPGRPLRAVLELPSLGSRRMDIEGSGALVVGGASGLGEATARRLHQHGAELTIADINVEKGEALAAG